MDIFGSVTLLEDFENCKKGDEGIVTSTYNNVYIAIFPSLENGPPKSQTFTKEMLEKYTKYEIFERPDRAPNWVLDEITKRLLM